MQFTPEEFPKIISVDDHVMEPPTVWSDRLPEKFRAAGPTMHRRKVAEMTFVGGVFSYREANEGEDGTWCDWWDMEDLRYPLTRVMAAAGVPLNGPDAPQTLILKPGESGSLTYTAASSGMLIIG